jgi:hypothetical protein
MTFPENAPDRARKRAPVWLKVVGIGCAGVILLALVAAGLVVRSWPKLTGYYRLAKSNFSELLTVQAAIEKKYGAEVWVTVKRESGTAGSIVSVTLVNAPLMDRVSVDSPDGRRAALDVAVTARDALPPGSRYDNLEVVFMRQSDTAGAGVSGSWSFRFKVGELPPATAEPAR